jgi:hypothetical protein
MNPDYRRLRHYVSTLGRKLNRASSQKEGGGLLEGCIFSVARRPPWCRARFLQCQDAEPNPSWTAND